MSRECSWDRKVVQGFMEKGFSHEQAMQVLGEVAEQRQRAYMQGYSKGFNDGAEMERQSKTEQGGSNHHES